MHATSNRRTAVERLTALDVSNLRVEEHGLPMHVAALALLDGGALLDASGQLRLENIRAHVEKRSRRAPRLRQVLAWPGLGLGPPLWVDDQNFDIAQHVRTQSLPAPGDEDSLLAACCQLNEPWLDRNRPLWEMWLLTGLTGNRIGLLIRLHHVVADGIAAMALLGSLFDLAPEAPAPEAPPYDNRPRPSRMDVLRSNLGHHRDAVRHTLTVLAHPTRPVPDLAVRAGQLAAVARQGRAPVVSLNRPVGPHRRLMILRADLAATKAVAHRHDAKVNDVVLAAVAGGARRLLQSRGELTPDLVLKVSVAASVRRAEDAGSGGNRVGVRVVSVPVGEPDPVRRLAQIAAATAAQRGRPPYQPGGRLLQRWMVRVMFRQHLVNLLLSNVPGPTMPVYFAGARVLEMFQIGVVQGNLAIGVGVLSYAGQLNLDVIADADAIPDVAVFTRGVSETFEQLGTAAPKPAVP